MVWGPPSLFLSYNRRCSNRDEIVCLSVEKTGQQRAFKTIGLISEVLVEKRFVGKLEDIRGVFSTKRMKDAVLFLPNKRLCPMVI